MMTIPWNDHAFVLYLIALCFYVFCTTIFVWWWWHSRSASSFYLAFLLLLLGGVSRTSVTMYGAALVVNNMAAFVEFRRGYIWPIRIYVELGALCIIALIIIYRLRSKYYQKSETRDMVAKHEVENVITSLQGLRRRALAAIDLIRNAIIDQEQQIKRLEAWLRNNDNGKNSG